MSVIDLLLETDVNKLQDKTKKKYEIKRLSELLGKPFVITCNALTPEQFQHICEISKSPEETKINAVLEGCRIEGQKFTNAKLLEKFKVVTGKELLQSNKLLRIGEIMALYNCVNDLSGYGRDSVQEVKNS